MLTLASQSVDMKAGHITTESPVIRKSKQSWEIGQTVKIGFLTLVVTAKEPTPGDYAPDAYRLRSQDGVRTYRFVPHNGLERLS